jgi:hypothetical protein
MRRLLAILALAIPLSACRLLGIDRGDVQALTPPASPAASVTGTVSLAPISSGGGPSPSIEIPPPAR